MNDFKWKKKCLKNKNIQQETRKETSSVNKMNIFIRLNAKHLE